MKKTKFYLIGMVVIFILLPLNVMRAASSVETEGITIHPDLAKKPPQIDGNLDDEIWQHPPLKKEFITYNPLYGEKLSYATQVWLAYDSKNLYFAFKCYDNEPQKIKTSITRRDNMFTDDWVGIKLDAQGNKQTSYDLFCNPNGIQGDILTSAVGGEDVSPDFVWDSAGKVTKEGYQVEMRIPLRSIQFKSGKEVTMGILFWRRISRQGISGSWPDITPGKGIFNVLATAVYKNLKNPLKLELLPSITYGNNSDRINNDKWEGEDTTEFGIGLKYGITSSITADITINPDFSQVETDSFQVEVNQRYPLFYQEKRPFFMEGIDIFSFFTAPHSYFITAVHTRRIVDPAWGVKLTGTVGKTAFGVLSAGDEWPGQPWQGETNPHEGKDAIIGIIRAKTSLGKDNYLGAIYSGRDFAGSYNRVFGVDFSYRPFKNQYLNLSFLHSTSRAGKDEDIKSSKDFNFVYGYNTRSLGLAAAFEHVGKDFRMDSAFLRRTGISEGWIWINPNFYPDAKKYPWLKRISPELVVQYLHDHTTGMDDTYVNLGVNINFTRQGYLGISFIHSSESWNQETFGLLNFGMNGSVQLTKWLRLSSHLNVREGIYYQANPSFKGSGVSAGFGITLQPNKNLNQNFSYSHTGLSKEGETLYDVNIFFSRTTYQFNKYFFLRAIIQYNDFQEKLLTDFLASFTLIPGTVLHLGYGGLYDRRQWQTDRWIFDQGNFTNYRRNFFFKASYLLRL